jgi:MEMO1 family protein
MDKVLNPSVAGTFYSSDSSVLRAEIEGLLAQADADLPIPKAIIAPHAGYSCSGKTAAAVYGCLKNTSKIKQVILLGPAHRYPFEGLAVTDANYMATPLGNVAVDKKAIAKILSLSQVNIVNAAYGNENSLEVQLPFLQVLLKDFLLVPLLIGNATNQQVVEVLEDLWGGDETLVVVSSDLSHYLDYSSAKDIDQKTVDAILALQPEKIGYEQACGRMAINALLTVAAKKKLQPKLIDLCNSGDTIGSKDQVVGYVGVHFMEES